MGFQPRDVERLYPGVDLERFAPDPGARARIRRVLGVGSDTRPLVAFLGSDYRRKGVDTLIAALARAARRAWIRDRRRTAPIAALRFESEANAAGLGARVHWLGVQPDPQRWLAAADLMLFPTRFDAFGSAVLEALACGVPAVVSRRAGAAELVRRGQDRRGARRARRRRRVGGRGATVSRTDAARRAARARARDAEGHPWSRHIERVLEVYSELSLRRVPKGESPVAPRQSILGRREFPGLPSHRSRPGAGCEG